MTRPYFKVSIAELEAALADRGDDLPFLDALLDELGHRTTLRAGRLRQRVQQHLSRRTQRDGAAPSRAVASPQEREEYEATPRGDDGALPTTPPPIEPAGRTTYPPITNTPDGILSAWIALEVLSPPTFTRPEDLPGVERGDIATIAEDVPWERGEQSRPNKRLYYEVILGSVKFEPALARLLERYADTRPDRPTPRERAILATVLVDRAGRLIASPAVAISSFAWGVMTALDGELTDLARWPDVERDLVKRVEAKLRTFTVGEEQGARPLTRDALLQTYRALVEALRLPPELVEPPTFAIRSYVYFKETNPPDAQILNSFFLKDLDSARQQFRAGCAPETLHRYLASIPPESRVDIRRDDHALREAIAPARTPRGRWPSKGRPSLVLLQQAAVNLALNDLRDGAILGVNGPPGTGKTTLLRDIVAGVVTERATAMVKFADPETAFTYSGERVRSGQKSWRTLYRVAPELRGHELIVASSNNKAVENVSAELPALGAIADDAVNLRYFKCMADVAHQRETWGMIGAVLGNKRNLSRFRSAFWWDEDVGMNRYLAAAAGTPQFIEEKDAATGNVKTRPPRVVAEERPPTSKQQALKQWKAARTHFAKTVEASRRWETWLESLRRVVADLPRLIRAVADAEGHYSAAMTQKSVAELRITAAEQDRETAEAARVAVWIPLRSALGEITATAIIDENVARVAAQEAWRVHVAAEDASTSARTAVEAHTKHRPGFFPRLFKTAAILEWSATAADLNRAFAISQTTLAAAQVSVATRENELTSAALLRQESENGYIVAGQVVKDNRPASAVLIRKYVEMLRRSPQTAAHAQTLDPLIAACSIADQQTDVAGAYMTECRGHLLRAAELLEAARNDVSVAQATHLAATAQLDDARSRGVTIPDDDFFGQDHDVVQRATAWYPHEAQRARDEVFTAAIGVHRAFIAAAAKPLRHNLGALISNHGLTTTEGRRALIPDLWTSLFLVVPMVSTTLAAVDRMLHDLPPQSLGWLLVDEAGQALPQAAVGALMRTRRSLVIGDPMQIEPIVPLPDTLTTAICRHMGVEPEQYAAPVASVQTLADAASPYVSEFQTRTGSREVGVPLLVHRRCAEPMFSISNAVAYANLMVAAKEQTTSSVRDTLGPSTWFHVEGSPEEKWCPEEGQEVLRLLRGLAAKGLVKPDVFVITPFRIVQDRLRQLVRENSVLMDLGVEENERRKWAEDRIGTVHTVQGREAEAVIFVLGAPSPAQVGARNWAGGRPNLLNVAVSRAKEALYVIGNRRLWREAGLFSSLADHLP